MIARYFELDRVGCPRIQRGIQPAICITTVGLILEYRISAQRRTDSKREVSSGLIFERADVRRDRSDPTPQTASYSPSVELKTRVDCVAIFIVSRRDDSGRDSAFES